MVSEKAAGLIRVQKGANGGGGLLHVLPARAAVAMGGAWREAGRGEWRKP